MDEVSGREPGRWVLLAYRMPREPSRPRIAVWRKLERLGVARLGDGLVGLPGDARPRGHRARRGAGLVARPADARTREHIDWLADEIGEAGGTATVWLSTPANVAQEQQIAAEMRAARAAEYQAVIDEAGAAIDVGDAERARLVRNLRAE